MAPAMGNSHQDIPQLCAYSSQSPIDLSMHLSNSWHRNPNKVTQNSSPVSSASSVPSSPSLGSSNHDSVTMDPALIEFCVQDTIISFLASRPEVEYAPNMVHVCLTLAKYVFIAEGNTNPCIEKHIKQFASFSDLSKDANAMKDCFAGMIKLMGWIPTSQPKVENSGVEGDNHDHDDDYDAHDGDYGTNTMAEAARIPSIHRISKFFSAFRSLMPDLAAYFDEEGVGSWGDEWVNGWVGWFFAKEMYDEDKARIWDFYLGLEDNRGQEFGNTTTTTINATEAKDDKSDLEGVDANPLLGDLHVNVCIALLQKCLDALEEMEQSEIRTLLTKLPHLGDLDSIFAEATEIGKRLRKLEEE